MHNALSSPSGNGTQAAPTTPAIVNAGRAALASGRVVVVKLGSSVICPRDGGGIDTHVLVGLGHDIAERARNGLATIIVSSGAVAAGRHVRGWPPAPRTLAEKQAFAAIGQPALVQAWAEALAPLGLTTAQALLTRADTEIRRRWLNARATLEELLRQGCVPVINENDTVATEELRHGDNDQLAARVAQIVGADVLVLLSDVDGVYTANPARDPSATRLDAIDTITPEIEALAAQTGGSSHAPSSADKGLGTGGMASKLAAAKLAMHAGCAVAITAGRADRPLQRLMNGGAATWFAPATSPRQARKTWIADVLTPQGDVQIDAGAAKAVLSGASLLPAGVVKVLGTFEKGEAVRVFTADGQELGRGLAGYDARDAAKLIGAKSQDFAGLIGYEGPSALIHRDDFVLLIENDHDH